MTRETDELHRANEKLIEDIRQRDQKIDTLESMLEDSGHEVDELRKGRPHPNVAILTHTCTKMRELVMALEAALRTAENGWRVSEVPEKNRGPLGKHPDGWPRGTHTKARSIVNTVSLDWCTYTCPCGAEFCTHYEKDLALWLAEHTPHGDGTILAVHDDDWPKTYATRPPDRRYKQHKTEESQDGKTIRD